MTFQGTHVKSWLKLANNMFVFTRSAIFVTRDLMEKGERNDRVWRSGMK